MGILLIKNTFLFLRFLVVNYMFDNTKMFLLTLVTMSITIVVFTVEGTSKLSLVVSNLGGVDSKRLRCGVGASALAKGRGIVTRCVGGVNDNLSTTIRGDLGGREVRARLVAGISRSLGAPLASVVGCMSLVGQRGPASPGVRRCLHVLSRGSRELGILARSIMRTSGTDAKGVGLRVGSVSFIRVIRRIVKRFRRGFGRGGLAVVMRFASRPSVVCTSNREV